MVKKTKTIKEIIESFIDSDSFSATAGKFLLMTLALGGIVFTGAIVSGMLSISKRSKSYTKQQIQNAVYNLKKRKLIEIIQEENNKIRAKLTNRGKERVKEFCLEALEIQKPNEWDKKWRVLIFDIPTKPKMYHQAREALRRKIKDLGFYQMQKSVWAYPYECEDEVLFVAELFQVQRHIEILTVGEMLHEEILKKKFKLTS